MALSSSVTMKNLTATIANIRGSARKMQPTINDMTKDFMNAHYALYIVNLSGTKPSTSSSPLPVGVDTNLLRSSAAKHQLNQYSYTIDNPAPYSAFLEDGTQHMTPRPALRDATEQIEKQVPGRMGEVITKVWEK